MSKRTTVVLAVIAAALLAFILVYERHTLSSGEVSDRADRLLERFVRDSVTRIEIDRQDGPVVLVREYEDDEDEVGTWRLAEPVEAGVDDEAVESLLGSLEWADARRELEEVGEEDRKRFGLTEPVLEARFTVKKEQVPIKIGKPDPTERGYYVQLDDPQVAYVVGKDLYEALDHDAGRFRQKELLPEREPEDADALAIASEEGERSLVLREGRWWLTEPFEAYADSALVRSALDAALGLRARRFVEEAPDDLASWGLEAPELEVRMEGPDSMAGSEEDEGAEERWQAMLAVGAPCEGHEGERYARAGDGPVVCVAAGDLDALRKEATGLRETQLTTVGHEALTRAEIRRGGTKLVLSSDDEGWQWKRGSTQGAADPEAVREWLRSMRVTEAEEFVALDVDGAHEHGLSEPRATIRLRRGEDSEAVLYLGAAEGEEVWVRRGSEPFALRVPVSAADAFVPSAVRFRERTLVKEKDAAARRIVIDRGETTERLERADEQWRITEPRELEADGTLTGQLVRHLANLEAERFVAEGPAAEHGLASPRWVVTVRFEGAKPGDDEGGEEPEPREHTLRVGGAAPGGAYAQLGSDPTVFVVPQGLLDAVEQPLVSREMLATARTEVSRVQIEGGGDMVTLICEGASCTQKGGAPADQERTRKLLDRLDALRATGATGYGAPPEEHGFGDPRARVTVKRIADADPPREYTFAVGATEGEGESARTHARRQDLEVGLLFPAYVMDTFADYRP